MAVNFNAPKEYPIPEEGLHQGVLVDIFALPSEQNKFGGTSFPAKMIWQLEARDEESGERYTVQTKIPNLSSSPKSILMKILKSWKIAISDFASFDLESLIGKNANLQINHVKSADGLKTYANIDAVLPVGKVPLLQPENYVRKPSQPF